MEIHGLGRKSPLSFSNVASSIFTITYVDDVIFLLGSSVLVSAYCPFVTNFPGDNCIKIQPRKGMQWQQPWALNACKENCLTLSPLWPSGFCDASKFILPHSPLKRR